MAKTLIEIDRIGRVVHEEIFATAVLRSASRAVKWAQDPESVDKIPCTGKPLVGVESQYTMAVKRYYKRKRVTKPTATTTTY